MKRFIVFFFLFTGFAFGQQFNLTQYKNFDTKTEWSTFDADSGYYFSAADSFYTHSFFMTKGTGLWGFWAKYDTTTAGGAGDTCNIKVKLERKIPGKNEWSNPEFLVPFKSPVSDSSATAITTITESSSGTWLFFTTGDYLDDSKTGLFDLPNTEWRAEIIFSTAGRGWFQLLTEGQRRY